MFDHSLKKWIPVLLNKGVIWVGIAGVDASNGLFKRGLHRVINNP